jgi:hypothetical protein
MRDGKEIDDDDDDDGEVTGPGRVYESADGAGKKQKSKVQAAVNVHLDAHLDHGAQSWKRGQDGRVAWIPQACISGSHSPLGLAWPFSSTFSTL